MEEGVVVVVGVGVEVKEAPGVEDTVGDGVEEALGHTTRRATLLLDPPSLKNSTPVLG